MLARIVISGSGWALAVLSTNTLTREPRTIGCGFQTSVAGSLRLPKRSQARWGYLGRFQTRSQEFPRCRHILLQAILNDSRHIRGLDQNRLSEQTTVQSG